MEFGPSTSRTCVVESCGYGPVTPGHEMCPLHSSCFSGGRYNPDACSTCSAMVSVLRSSPMDQVRRLPEWGALRDHLDALRQASMGMSPSPVLSAPEGFAAWFPSLFGEDSLASNGDSDRPPRGSGTPTRPQAPVPAEPALSMSSKVFSLEDVVDGFRRSMASMISSSSRGVIRPLPLSDDVPVPPPSKRLRVESTPSRDWTRPSEAPPSVAASVVDEEGDGASSALDVSLAGAGGLPPSASLGWKPKPDDWVVIERAGQLEGYYTGADRSFQVVPGMEFRKHTDHEGVSYFYRACITSAGHTLSARTSVHNLTSALPAMAARVAGSQAHPSFAAKKKNKVGLELEVGGSPVPSLLSWSDLPGLWSVRAAGNSFASTVKEEARFDASPCSLDWAPGTPEHATVAFLSAPPASSAPIPSSLQKPSSAALQEDTEVRSEALRVFTVSSCLDLVASLLGAAVDLPRDWSATDCRSFLSCVKDSVEGAAAILAPLTRERVRASISKRIALRDAAIPKDLAAVRSALLNVEPLSPSPYGSLGSVAEILRSRPPPAQLVLEKGALSALFKRQSDNSGKAGSSSGSSSKKRPAHRSGQSSRKSSPRRSGQQPAANRDSRPSHSSQNFRGSGRGGGRGGGRSSSEQVKSDAGKAQSRQY